MLALRVERNPSKCEYMRTSREANVYILNVLVLELLAIFTRFLLNLNIIRLSWIHFKKKDAVTEINIGFTFKFINVI